MADVPRANGSRPPVVELFSGDGDFGDFAEAFASPLFWPDLSPERASEEWDGLRRWVGSLIERFDLDSHVIPNCWWRHNHLVEALSALRDYERGCYGPTAPPTAAVDFHRAMRDIELRLRAWVGELRCEADHDPSHDRPRQPPDQGWEEWVAADAQLRRQRAVDAALAAG